MNLGEFCVLFSFHLLYSLIFCCCNLQSFHQRRMPSTTISKSTLCCLLTLMTLLVCCRRTRPLFRIYCRRDCVFEKTLFSIKLSAVVVSLQEKKNSTRFENVYINWYWMIANVRCLCSRPAWCLWVEGGKVRLRLLHHQCWLILCEWFEVLYWMFVDAALVFCHLTNFSYILKAYG